MLIEYVCEKGEVGYIGSTGIPKHSKLKNIWLVDKKLLLGIDKIGFNARIKNWIYVKSINGDKYESRSIHRK